MDTTDIIKPFNLIIDSLSLLKLQITDIQQKIRKIEKDIKKKVKIVEKTEKKNKNKLVKKPSGFAQPTNITNELCEFMERPVGTEIARTEVTKTLINYIKQNNLQEEGKISKIIPDTKLQKLLGIPNEKIPELTFFTIQKYMNKHFIKNKTNMIEH
jgi:chromatin remodeling complex protein RSC6